MTPADGRLPQPDRRRRPAPLRRGAAEPQDAGESPAPPVSSGSLTAEHVVRLQRTAGNSAVTAALHGGERARDPLQVQRLESLGVLAGLLPSGLLTDVAGERVVVVVGLLGAAVALLGAAAVDDYGAFLALLVAAGAFGAVPEPTGLFLSDDVVLLTPGPFKPCGEAAVAGTLRPLRVGPAPEVKQ